MSIQEVVEYLTAGKGALDLIKGTLSLIPKGEKADKAKEQIERAEQALKASEAAAAKALGYKLCQCTFPPQIMLWKESEGAYVCPECSHHEWKGFHISDEALSRLISMPPRRRF
jgi:hypothetical protein